MNPRLPIVAAMAAALLAGIIMQRGENAPLAAPPPGQPANSGTTGSLAAPAVAKPWKSSTGSPKITAAADHPTATGNTNDQRQLAALRDAAAVPTLPRRPRYLAGDFIEELRARRTDGAVARTEAGTIATAQAPKEFVLAPGMRLPAAVIAADQEQATTTDDGGDAHPATAARAALESTFAAELAEALGHPDVAADPVLAAKAYDSAKARADARYKILFGDAAFNQMGMKAANEALHAE